MRTITIEKKLYKFNELSEKAKKQAMETRLELENEVIGEYFKDVIADMLTNNDTGIEIDINDVWYSVSYSQGDGVSFVSNDINMEKALEFFGKQSPKHAQYVEKVKNNKNYQDVKLDYEFYIRRINSHYTHANTVDCDFNDTSGEWVEGVWQLAEIISNIINEVKNILCGEIYNELMDTDRYMSSEEYLTELLESENNEYTSDGAIY